jgi:hypothetical protein
MSAHALIAAFALLSGSHPALEVERSHGAEAPPAEPVTIPLKHNRRSLFTVDVSLGRQVLFSGDPDADPLPFIFDTGANRTAVPRLIAAQLTAEEDLEIDRIAHGMTGQFGTGLFFHDELDFGLGPQPMEIAVVSGAYGSIFSAAGILGSDVFADETILLNFPNEQLVVGLQDEVRSDLWFDHETGLIKGLARLRGRTEPVRLLLDTGAEVSLVNRALADLGRGRSPAQMDEVQGVDGDTGYVVEERRTFSGLEIGELCLGAFWISVADVYAFEFRDWLDEPAIIIGMDVLKDAQVRVDYGTGAVAIDGGADHQCRPSRADGS